MAFSLAWAPRPCVRGRVRVGLRTLRDQGPKDLTAGDGRQQREVASLQASHPDKPATGRETRRPAPQAPLREGAPKPGQGPVGQAWCSPQQCLWGDPGPACSLPRPQDGGRVSGPGSHEAQEGSAGLSPGPRCPPPRTHPPEARPLPSQGAARRSFNYRKGGGSPAGSAWGKGQRVPRPPILTLAPSTSTPAPSAIAPHLMALLGLVLSLWLVHFWGP